MTIANSSIITFFQKYWIVIAVLILILIAYLAYRKGKLKNAINYDVYNYSPNRVVLIKN